MALRDKLRRHGHDVREVVEETGLSAFDLEDARTMIPLAGYERLVKAALGRIGDPSLGLSVAAAQRDGPSQLLAHFAMAMSNMRSALDVLVRYGGVFVEGLRATLVPGPHFSELRFVYAEALHPDVERFSADYLIALCVLTARGVYGREAVPREVRFRHPEPHYARAYRALLGCDVAFSRPHCEVQFASGLLDRAPPSPDVFVADALQTACEEMRLHAPPRLPMTSRTRSLLLKNMALGQRITVDWVASELGLSRRRLRTALREESTSVSAILHETRLAYALAEMRRAEVGNKEIAAALGYSEVSAFYRAFKRWTGYTSRRFAVEQGNRPAQVLRGPPLPP